MLKANNKNTRKKCEIFPGGNYSEKNVWGEFDRERFSEGGLLTRVELFRGNYLGVVFLGGIFQG